MFVSLNMRQNVLLLNIHVFLIKFLQEEKKTGLKKTVTADISD